ncbi:hypothetical protein LRAMOSA00246 [Lichtheimia ramosa]|uniref:SWIRM domain-containing protein n=1 Tax=Lichtheimia ramosa TaxID=688394 RepID=A0A077W9R6_9FUNG|nr:hypothetical protein LRAMOSA00246 [Lichtheimia ramosa]
MSYHLRKRCDQESTKENDSTSHLKRRTKRITRQQQNESFNLNFYKELRRSLVKETVQETHECIQPSTTDNVVSSQRCNAKNTGIRQRTTRDWKLDFTIPLEYQYASLDIDSADNEFYSLPEWLPNMDRVDQVMLELKIGHQETCEAYINDPYLPRLHPSEKSLAAHLRIPASKYLRCKRALIMSAYEFRKHGVSMRPFDAQKLLRINANKSYRLHKIFQKFGWLEPHSSTS